MTQNINNIQMLLQKAIENASSSGDWLLLSKAIQTFNIGQVRTVSTYAALPSAAANQGVLMFVEADERIYWSTGSAWFNLVTDSQAFAWAWGCNSVGAVGDNTTTGRSSPVSVVGAFSDWCCISAGGFFGHSTAVRTNGSAWAWGFGEDGQLGNNTVTCTSSPASVVGGFTDWCGISAGCRHSLAVRINGTAWAWGCNNFGLLGNNTTTNRSSPVSVVGGFGDWCGISAGNFHNAANRTNGTIWSWGRNNSGQLGQNSTVNSSSPVSAVGGFSDWCAVGAGIYHTVAVRTNGSAWSWGRGGAGRLGNGTDTDRSSPVSVVGGFSNWCAASANGFHSVALRTNGTSWAWGFNSSGQLGDNSVTNSNSPVSVVGGFTNWCGVSAGDRHSLAVRTSGSAWAWGCGGAGRLGNNDSSNRSSPVSVVGGFGDWCQVSAGVYHSVALRQTNFT